MHVYSSSPFISSTQNFLTNHLVLISSLTTAGVGLVLLRRWFAGGVCRSKCKLDGKTVIITGANTGIGKETAKDLARRGARVILACRDILKAERARHDIITATGNGNIVVHQLDLASLASVRRFADTVLRDENRIHVLVNNAGVMKCPPWKTADGYEYQFGVNHLGHFLLTTLLLDRLKQSAPARIVNVSSNAYKRREGCLDLTDVNFESRKYDDWSAYAQSKLANILFTRELTERLEGSGVTAVSLHPGVIRTELGRHMWPELPWWRKLLVVPFILLVFKSPRQGAQTSIHCAVDDSVQRAPLAGKFFSDCAVKELKPFAENDKNARELWKLSEQMVAQK